MTPTAPLPPRPPERSSAASLLIGLLLAGATLTGCHPASPREHAAPSTQARPTSGSASDPAASASGCREAVSGMDHAIEGPGSREFDITQEQLAVIGRRLIEVLCGQGLWQQDVGFGVQYQKGQTHVRVRISPGRSGLTARQVLDRLLGRG